MKIEKQILLSVLVFLSAITLFAPISVAQAESYRGFYIFGHEVRTFQPCGSKHVYWVRAEVELTKRLRDEHRKLTSKPYEPIYIEVQGHLTNKADQGFAADYDGQIVIEALDLSRGRQKGDCSPNAASRFSP